MFFFSCSFGFGFQRWFVKLEIISLKMKNNWKKLVKMFGGRLVLDDNKFTLNAHSLKIVNNYFFPTFFCEVFEFLKKKNLWPCHKLFLHFTKMQNFAQNKWCCKRKNAKKPSTYMLNKEPWFVRTNWWKLSLKTNGSKFCENRWP